MNRNNSSQALLGTRPTLPPAFFNHLRILHKGVIEGLEQLESFIRYRANKSEEAKALESQDQQSDARRTLFLCYVTTHRSLRKFDQANHFPGNGRPIKWNIREEDQRSAIIRRLAAARTWMNTPSPDGRNPPPCAFTVTHLPPSKRGPSAVVAPLCAELAPVIV